MAKKQIIKNRALLDHIAPTALKFEENNLFMTDTYAAILVIDKFPQYARAGFLAPITKLDGVGVSVHSHSIPNNKLLNILDETFKNRRLAAAENDNASQQYALNQKDQVTTELYELLYTKNETASFCTILVRVEASDKEDLKGRIDFVNSKLSASGLRASTLAFLQEDGQFAILPYNMLDKRIADYNKQIFPSSTLASLFVFDNSSLKDNAGVILGRDQDSNIVLYDMWIKEGSRGNSNIICTGASGAGKSATIKKLLISEAGRNSVILIIDPEAEYKDLCSNLNGSYLDLAGGGTCINPLQINATEDRIDEETGEILNDYTQHLRYLNNFFSIYLKGLDSTSIAYLLELTEDLYKQFGFNMDTDFTKVPNNAYPLMQDLYKLIVEKQEETRLFFKERERSDYEVNRIEKIRVLTRQAAEGADAPLFNQYTNVDMSNDFIVFNVQQLMNAPDNLKKAQYFNILNYCWGKLTDRERHSLLLCDEAHMLIDKEVPDTAKTLSKFMKRVRKYDSSLIIITQEIQDFLHPSVSEYGIGIMNNASTRFLQGADGAALQTIIDVYHINDSEKAILEKKERGKMLMITGDIHLVCKVELKEWELDLMGAKGGK